MGMITRAGLAVLALALPAQAAQAEVMDTLARMQAAAAARGDVVEAVIDEADLSVKVTMADGNSVTMSPDNLDRVLEGLASDAEKDAEVAAFVGQMGSLQVNEGPKVTKQTLADMRLVVSASDLYSGTETADIKLWRGDIAPGLAEYLVLDSAGSVSYLSSADVGDSGLSGEALRAKAAEALAAMRPRAQVEVLSEAPWISGIVLDGFYECSLMSLPEFWEDLTAQNGPIGAACPARGQLYVFGRDDAEAVGLMRGFIDNKAAEFSYPVSTALYGWDGTGWQVLE